MRNISSDLKTAFKSGKIASLIKITTKLGAIHGYTDHDVQLTVGGQLYMPAPGLSKIKQHQTVKADVSNQTLQAGWVDAPASDLIAGVFDEAQVEVAWCSWADVTLGKVVTFTGLLGQITWDADGFHTDIYSLTNQLARQINLNYLPTCRHRLYGTAATGLAGFCGISQTAFTSTGTITGVIASKWSFSISVVQPDGYYTGSSITFTSGNNAGLTFEVKNHSANTIDLYLPTAFLVNSGDAFSITAGCDKTMATCKARFNNVNNFGGFPHIQPQTNFR